MKTAERDPERFCPACGLDHTADFEGADLATLRRAEVKVMLLTNTGRMTYDDVAASLAAAGDN